jgi:hypothetical protein
MGHETVGSQGMVSGLAAVDDYYYLGKIAPPTGRVKWRRVWHQTRHPLAAIPSLAKAMRVSFWHWQHRHTGVPGDTEPVLLRSARFWLAWMEKIDARAPEWTYRVEDIEERWPEMLGRLGIEPKPIPSVSSRSYTSGAEQLRWSDLIDIDLGVADAVRKRAEAFGYV